MVQNLFENYNIKLSDEQLEKFLQYYELLIEANKTMNLTTITDEKEVWIKHFLDSVLPIEDISQKAKVIDIGTGAGFPGIPLKILRPDIELTLVDSLAKRTKFLDKLCTHLKIKVEIIHSRAEELAKSKHREKYDICVARAVSPLVTLAEYTLPFVKVGGALLAYKASQAGAEVNSALFAISVMGGYFVKENIFALPENMGQRNILMIKKVEHTPVIYPRGQNMPKLKPLVK